MELNMRISGTYQWIYQRFSTILIIAYTVVYLSLIISMEYHDFATWKAIHEQIWFKVYSSITLLVVMINSLLAGWQIGTDYTQKVPIAGFGTVFHIFYVIGSIGILGLGLYILWGL